MSAVSGSAMLAVLICEELSFCERMYEMLVHILFSSLHFYSWCTHSVKALCTSGSSPGYHWVGSPSSVSKLPLLKLCRFCLLAWSLSRTASLWSSLHPSCLLSFSFMLAFFHPLQLFRILFSFCFSSVSHLKFRASLPPLLKHFTPLCHSLRSFPLLGADASECQHQPPPRPEMQ